MLYSGDTVNTFFAMMPQAFAVGIVISLTISMAFVLVLAVVDFIKKVASV